MIARLINNMLHLLKSFKISLNYDITRDIYYIWIYFLRDKNCVPQLCVSLYIQYISGR